MEDYRFRDDKDVNLLDLKPNNDDHMYADTDADEDWMRQIDVSRFANDVATFGFRQLRQNSDEQLELENEESDERIFPKPAYSYSCLIALALKNSVTGQLTVSEIYSFMCEHFPYFRTAPSGWKNSVRHNLSLNKCFMKVDLDAPDVQGRKACLWMIRPEKAAKMEHELEKWRQRDQDGIENAMCKPEDFTAIREGYKGLPASGSRYHQVMNSRTSKNTEAISVSQSHSERHVVGTSSSQQNNTSYTPSLSSQPASSRVLLDLNDRVSAGVPASITNYYRGENNMRQEQERRQMQPQPVPSHSSSIRSALPVRISRSGVPISSASNLTVMTSSPMPKPNILRRSHTVSTSSTSSGGRRSPPCSSMPQFSETLMPIMPPSLLERLQTTPPKSSSKKEDDDFLMRDLAYEESPLKMYEVSSYEAAQNALTNNSLLVCALDQSPYKGPVTFPTDLKL